ncbi:hypothetical protein M8818_002515 [Zalaria obscura]|uniref:Uncharacterized protein n=1 Tax=Zalaria obscura TaxID=2024903 RepID=A0ACC3SH06_9PEZI
MVITFITFNGVSHTLFCALSPFHTVTLFLQGRLGAPNLHPVLYHASCVYLWLLLGELNDVGNATSMVLDMASGCLLYAGTSSSSLPHARSVYASPPAAQARPPRHACGIRDVYLAGATHVESHTRTKKCPSHGTHI